MALQQQNTQTALSMYTIEIKLLTDRRRSFFFVGFFTSSCHGNKVNNYLFQVVIQQEKKQRKKYISLHISNVGFYFFYYMAFKIRKKQQCLGQSLLKQHSEWYWKALFLEHFQACFALSTEVAKTKGQKILCKEIQGDRQE